MNYEKCFHCGAEYGLHQSETEHCPVGGVEETREGKKQQWAETIFVDAKKRKLEDAAPMMHKILKAIDAGARLAKASGTPLDCELIIMNTELALKDTQTS